MDNDEVFVLAALGIICTSIIVVSMLKLARSYIESRAHRPMAELPRGVEERLQTIQATVEATAIEIERVAESNRFLTRLLRDTSGTPAPHDQRSMFK